MNATRDAALLRVQKSLADFRFIVEGLSPEALNWAPAADTNSIAVQVAHSVRSAGFYLDAAAGLDRDIAAYLALREDAFNFGADAGALTEMLASFEGGLRRRFDAVSDRAMTESIDWRPWDRGLVTGAWCLLSVVEHIREHVGAAGLTRQLWEQRDRR